ncbi:uncharacterized protein LOC125894709 isoform X4 [Epinephelus fuscoguttatus]|uniref:uncharacterized protein LOC125894709 isoform X4 n=1 Tax=Epinephelus fuscoguttatus TaxID=293821 RepID=UPI0020D0F99E|nr:uncharacterized protein LOC125894709 isoform X4 [Epinephelus fuscoguttatus]
MIRDSHSKAQVHSREIQRKMQEKREVKRTTSLQQQQSMLDGGQMQGDPAQPSSLPAADQASCATYQLWKETYQIVEVDQLLTNTSHTWPSQAADQASTSTSLLWLQQEPDQLSTNTSRGCPGQQTKLRPLDSMPTHANTTPFSGKKSLISKHSLWHHCRRKKRMRISSLQKASFLIFHACWQSRKELSN